MSAQDSTHENDQNDLPVIPEIDPALLDGVPEEVLAIIQSQTASLRELSEQLQTSPTRRAPRSTKSTLQKLQESVTRQPVKGANAAFVEFVNTGNDEISVDEIKAVVCDALELCSGVKVDRSKFEAGDTLCQVFLAVYNTEWVRIRGKELEAQRKAELDAAGATEDDNS